jgi:hypothetical protein
VVLIQKGCYQHLHRMQSPSRKNVVPNQRGVISTVVVLPTGGLVPIRGGVVTPIGGLVLIQRGCGHTHRGPGPYIEWCVVPPIRA